MLEIMSYLRSANDTPLVVKRETRKKKQ